MTSERAVEAGYPEGTIVRVEDMGPVERAYAEAMHEDCEDGPPHPLTAHSPWSGGDLDGTEPWPAFTARLARHGLRLAAARGEPPTAWLVERGQPEKQVPTVWRADDGSWTEDANKAQRFATRDLAEACIEANSPIPRNRDRIGRAAEHGWLAARGELLPRVSRDAAARINEAIG